MIGDFKDYFFKEIIGDVSKYGVLMLYNEMCQYLRDLYNLVNQYFPDGQCML